MTAPTGSAGFNVQGTTCHSQFGVKPKKPEGDLTEYKIDQLRPRFRFSLCLIFDERSMMSCPLLGACERNCRKLLHNGMDEKKDWGNVPIVLLFGDDYQLPSVNKFNEGRGATYIFNDKGDIDYDEFAKSKLQKSSEWLCNEMNGVQNFVKLATNVVEFTKTHRVEEGQNMLRDILKTMRDEDGLNDQQAEDLLSRHLSSGKVSQERIEWLKHNATWIFPTNEQVSEKNYDKIKDLVNKDNPVCNLFGEIRESETNNTGRVFKSHFESDALQAKSRHCTLCRQAKCALDRNVWAEKGLYNGAIVTVIEIRFEKGRNPNLGHEPVYVIIDCPSYTGPAWIPEHPTWLPLPMCDTFCKRCCCKITQTPLQLGFARTGQKFQGLQVGPTHNIKAIVADPGSINNEARCPGYTYMICSRVSTIGATPNDSALYFTGNANQRERFTDLTHKRSGQGKYESIKKRENWLKFVTKQKDQTDMKLTKEEMTDLKHWANETRINQTDLHDIIEYHSHQGKLQRN